MKKLWKLAGTLIFFLLWPFWFVYFRVSNKRTRVVLIADNKVLLVKGWLGRNCWSLPGGGVKKSESLQDSATREIREETGLIIGPDILNPIGQKTNNSLHLRYVAYFFKANLKSATPVNPSFPEIIDTKWVSLSKVDDYRLSKEAKFAIDLAAQAEHQVL